MRSLSVVIPVFRNQGSLKLTYEKLVTLFRTRTRIPDYEIIFVDDGSDDGSLAELVLLHKKDRKVKVLSFSRNFGQLYAIIAGLKEVTGEAAVIMSADLQDPVEVISGMVREWEKGNEIVIAYRNTREDNLLASLTSRVFYKLMRLVNPRMPLGGFDFCLLDRRCVEEMNRIGDKNRFFQGDVLGLGFNVKLIPYTRLKRPIGKSQWTFSKKLKYFLDGVISSSYIPIRFISITGMITSLFGFIYGIIILYAKIFNKVPFIGWTPIMMLILFIGGLIMLMLGIIGEYIWRIYDENKKRPLYILRKRYARPGR